MDLHKPKVYGDHLMAILAEVGVELDAQDEQFILDETLSYFEDDVQNYARIRRSVVGIHAELQRDSMRGDNALEALDREIFSPFLDLVYRLVESKKYPAFSNLYYFMQDNFY